MGLQYNSGFCVQCDAKKKIERDTPNHILHLLITIVLGVFTAGIGAIFWICIWFLSSITIGGWRCSDCGAKKIKDVEGKYYSIFLFVLLIVLIFVYRNYAP